MFIAFISRLLSFSLYLYQVALNIEFLQTATRSHPLSPRFPERRSTPPFPLPVCVFVILIPARRQNRRHLVARMLRWASRLARPAAVQHRWCSSGAQSGWVREFKSETVDLASMDVDSITYQESAARLRELLKTQLLKLTDLRDDPERFFLAHRILAGYAPRLGPGFWIRFTVHYNLCAGTVLAIGSDEQVALLADMQKEGLLGCFALTEKLAGVSSGLVVNTVAVWDPATETFKLNTPDSGATKNWISQGLVADKAVVIADLHVGGKSRGPHGFFVDLRKNGKLTPGVVQGDMGKKTVGNDLDNAWIAFDNVVVPKAALLNRYADVEGEEYVQKVEGVPVFHMIGQRLFTGRVAVAQAALEFRRSVFAQTQRFTDLKDCWCPTGTRTLSSMPQLSTLYTANEASLKRLDAFVRKCEAELSVCLKGGTMPALGLVEAIAVAKVVCVEDSIKAVHNLKNEVGSYALMQGTGFEQADFLTCCKFAEGDSRILMQKLARDRVRVFKKKELDVPAAEWSAEQTLCDALARNEEDFDAVYKLADLIMERVMATYLGEAQ